MDNLENTMREWLIDCFCDEDDQAEIEELTYAELIDGVNRYYHGGLKQFKLDCLPCGWTLVEA